MGDQWKGRINRWNGLGGRQWLPRFPLPILLDLEEYNILLLNKIEKITYCLEFVPNQFWALPRLRISKILMSPRCFLNFFIQIFICIRLKEA